MDGAEIAEDTYTFSGYTFESVNAAFNNGEGQPGDVAKIYVNDKPEISAEGGSGKGNYVIVEFYTDYLGSGETESFTSALSVGVTQSKDIAVGEKTVPAVDSEVKNYTKTESAGGMGGMY